MATSGTRTFDCPWCGAISPVPADHLGEHFECPECKKGTKLTEKNTSTRAPTAVPPDAPHLSGDRTFDCPWCGAISSVPSSHLGEAFQCEECSKSTKLTSTNTRRAAVTAPPPDAPHLPAGGGVGGKIAVAAIALLAAGGIWWFTAGSGGETPAKPDESAAVGKGPAVAAPTPSTPAAVPTPPPTSPGTPVPPPAPPSSMAPDSTGGTPPAPSPADAEREAAAKLAEADRAQKFLLAEQAVAVATKRLAEWGDAHPGALEARDLAAALTEMSTAIDRALADQAPDAAKATPDQMRAADAAIRAFFDGDAARKRAAEAVLVAMRSDHGGREVAGVTDWRELHVAGEGFRRSAAGLRAGHEALASTVPADLVQAVADAVKARDALKPPAK